MNENTWKALIAHIRQNQDGAIGSPSDWILEKMAGFFDCYPLRFGGDDYGYLFWMKSQGASIIKGMGTLKGVLQEFDSEVGLRLAAESRVRELEALLANKSQANLPPVPVDTANDVESKGKGQQAYEGRVRGQDWTTLGGNAALASAKKYAKTRDLPWPPAQEAEPEPS